MKRYRRKIDTNIAIAAPEPRYVKLDTPRIDTSTQLELIILDFVNQSNVIIKRIGAPSEVGKYHLRKNKLKIRSSDFNVKGYYVSQDSLVLIGKYKTVSSSETHFEPIKTSVKNNQETLDSRFFSNSYWVLTSDTSISFR